MKLPRSSSTIASSTAHTSTIITTAPETTSIMTPQTSTPSTTTLYTTAMFTRSTKSLDAPDAPMKEGQIPDSQQVSSAIVSSTATTTASNMDQIQSLASSMKASTDAKIAELEAILNNVDKNSDYGKTLTSILSYLEGISADLTTITSLGKTGKERLSLLYSNLCFQAWTVLS